MNLLSYINSDTILYFFIVIFIYLIAREIGISIGKTKPKEIIIALGVIIGVLLIYLGYGIIGILFILFSILIFIISKFSHKRSKNDKE